MIETTEKELFYEILNGRTILAGLPNPFDGFDETERLSLAASIRGNVAQVQDGILNFLRTHAEVTDIDSKPFDLDKSLGIIVLSRYHIRLTETLKKTITDGAMLFTGALSIYGGAFVQGSIESGIAVADLVCSLYQNFSRLNQDEQNVYRAMIELRKNKYATMKNYYPSEYEITSELGISSTRLSQLLSAMKDKGIVERKDTDTWWITW